MPNNLSEQINSTFAPKPMNSQLYIDLLKKSLTDTLRINREVYFKKENLPSKIANFFLKPLGYGLCKTRFIKLTDEFLEGKNHAPEAETLIGIKRLECIESCVKNIVKNNIEGDLLEAGVWRGGATIFMRGLLDVLNDQNRKIFAADSYEGCPPPTKQEDMKDNYYKVKLLDVGLEIVKNNFSRYDLLDDRVVFLKGWFKDTLPNGPFNKLSLIRVDGDMYESTMDALVNTYHKLSKGGYLLVDDYGGIEAARKAVDDFRKQNNITDPIIKVDWTGIYWQKS
jgi:O-methyltransferase